MREGFMVAWASELIGMNTLEAYQLITQLSLPPAANVCDQNYTMTGKLPMWVSDVGPTPTWGLWEALEGYKLG